MTGQEADQVLTAIASLRRDVREDVRELGQKVDKTARHMAAAEAKMGVLQKQTDRLEEKLDRNTSDHAELKGRVDGVERGQAECPARTRAMADATGTHRALHSVPPAVRKERIRARAKIAVAVIGAVSGLLLAYLAGRVHLGSGGQEPVRPADVHVFTK